MGQPLTVCAYFVLAFDDVDPAFPQHSPSFPRSLKIEIEDGFVIFLLGLGCIVFVINLEVLMSDMRGSPRGVHVRRIEDNAIHRTITVWELPTVYAVSEV